MPRKASRTRGQSSNEIFAVLILGVLGRLELALGDLEGCRRATCASCRDGSWRRGLNDPTQPVWADAIETLIGLGELEQARAYLEPYEANAQRLGSPLALAAGAARCRGLLAAAEGALPGASAALEASLADAAPFPFERGRTLLCLGAVRRQAQQKKAAREALEQALAIFEELGARLWAEKARAELRRISGRRPPDEELTETERRVAELAAQGRTNKEIAAELFMGVSTVEAHLSRVYRKLGIRSRTELAGRIAASGVDAAKTMGEHRPTLGLSRFRTPAPEPHPRGMVFVVERYLPGLSRSDLLHGLSRLEQTTESTGGALPRLDHRPRRRGLLLPVRRALGSGRRRGEPEGGASVRPDRPRTHRHTRREHHDDRLTVHSVHRRDAAKPAPRPRRGRRARRRGNHLGDGRSRDRVGPRSRARERSGAGLGC